MRSRNADADYLVAAAVESLFGYIDSRKGSLTDEEIAYSLRWIDLRDSWGDWTEGSDD